MKRSDNQIRLIKPLAFIFVFFENEALKFTLFLLLSVTVNFFGCTHTEDCVENIKFDCFCTKEYRPVCGCNNKTYGNLCEANCAGITKYSVGACK